MTEMVYGTGTSRQIEPIFSKWLHTVDRWSILCVCALFLIGLLLGLAASPPLAAKNGHEPFHYVSKQVLFGSVAIFTMLVISVFSKDSVRRISVVLFFSFFLLLAGLPFWGTDFGKGATRWYSFGVGSFQPSEFLKPFFIVVVAWLVTASQKINGPPGKAIALIFTILVVSLLGLQPDFGQAVLILFSWGVIYFVAGAPFILLLSTAGLVVIAGLFLYSTSEHFARRIDNFLISEVDPTTQIGYASNAIREGGFFGVGVGEGTVKWQLPDAHTDFIIAVAAEEYGLFLVLMIIALYVTFTIRSLHRLSKKKDPFVRLSGVGLASIIAMQAMINLGVAVRLLPAKGMTLPFVSNGGSSLIASGIAVGMLLVFTKARPQGEIRDLLVTKRTFQ